MTTESDKTSPAAAAAVAPTLEKVNGEETLPPPPLPPPVVKPQFYFGQTMTDLVRGGGESSTKNGIYKTAIDKVKQNEALTHPKRAEELQSKVTELNDKGRHMSIITTSVPPASSSSSQNGEKSNSKFSPKAASLSSGVSSLSSSSSSNSSTRSSPAKDVSNSSPKAPLRPIEPSQDTVRKAFEAQLIAGKNRLKKVEDEVGQMARLPPAPVPPPAPPPPPTEEKLHKITNGSSTKNHLRSYEIPQAPKLKKTPPNLASKKGLVAPNGLSAREELMMAIRGTGGFQGLRKVLTKSNYFQFFLNLVFFGFFRSILAKICKQNTSQFKRHRR